MNIKQTIKLFISGLLLVSGLIVSLNPTSAVAQQCGGVSTSLITCDEDGGYTCNDGTPVVNRDEECADGSTPQGSPEIESTGLWGVLILAINVLTGLVAVAALGGIVYGSILYTSAGGSSEQTKKAIGIIGNVVIGVIAYALMYVGLNFLVPGGVFN